VQESFDCGDKRALFEALCICGEYRPLPEWVVLAIRAGRRKFEDGQLESWDQIFGKAYPGKSRKTAVAKARAGYVWAEVQHLKNQGHPIDSELFEEVSRRIKKNRGYTMKRSTVANLYRWFDRAYQPAWPAEWMLDSQN
jgi:hypothetical protein